MPRLLHSLVGACAGAGQSQKEQALQVVFLSPDASEPLFRIDTNHVYIIGGIVDKTVEKYRSLFYAAEHGITVRLTPVGDCHH